MKTKNYKRTEYDKKFGFFPITSVHRDDIRENYIGAENLTDEQMEDLAGRLAETFLESGLYWQVIDEAAIDWGLKPYSHE